MNIENLMADYFSEKSILKNVVSNGLCSKCQKVHDILKSNNARKGKDKHITVLFDEILYPLNIQKNNPHISNLLFEHYLFKKIKTEYHHSKHDIEKDAYLCFDCMTVLKIEFIDHRYASIMEFVQYNQSLDIIVGHAEYIIEKYKDAFVNKLKTTNDYLLKDFNNKKQKELLELIILNDFLELIESQEELFTTPELIEYVDNVKSILQNEI